MGASSLGIPGPHVASAAPPPSVATSVDVGEQPTERTPLRAITALPWRANLIALSWRSDDPSADGVVPSVRTRLDGGAWSEPVTLLVQDDEAPDLSAAEVRARRVFTPPLWVELADEVEVTLAVAGGSAPVRDVQVEAINANGDAQPVPVLVRAARAVGRFLTATATPPAAEASAPRPGIIRRKHWGADEGLRSDYLGAASELKMAFVHHTAGNNNYSKSQSAGIVRAIYAYHTQTLDYPDIAYNFLIDRYGQIFEGMHGGIAQAIIAAHTGGFNTYSTGIALMGSFVSERPPTAMTNALVRLLAWKLDVHHIPADGSVVMTAMSDNSKYDQGDRVRFPRIAGHQEASSTACPGVYTMNLLPSIRRRVEERGQPKIELPRLSTDVVRPDGDGVVDRVRLVADLARSAHWAWRITDGAGRTVWSTSGTGTRVKAFWDATDGAGTTVASGRYRWTLTAERNGRKARPATGELMVLAPQPGGCGTCAGTSADFDDDGYDDLAIGVPGEDIGSRGTDAGAVNVLYGSADGITAARDQFFYDAKIGLDPNEAGDGFGAALASGDFDGDGFADLAVGSPREDRPGAFDAGAVTILYGTSGGLRAGGAQFLTRASLGGTHAPMTGDVFGSTLASGDFDNDGRDDLLVGVPGADIQGAADAGMVATFYGSDDGLVVRASPTWHQGRAGVASVPQPQDRFGAAVSAGDIDGDNRDDAVIGAPGEMRNGAAQAGAVHLIYGANGGLGPADIQFWHQGRADSTDTPEAGDQAGFAVAVGDVDGDNRDDVAIGVPGEELGTAQDAGAVWVLSGSINGAVFAAPQVWHADAADLPGEAGRGDRFGSSLVLADLSGDTIADLAIGLPGDDVGSQVDAGSVTVLYGTGTGLLALGSQSWDEGSPGVPGGAREGDGFASALTAGDFDGSGAWDLAIGVPGEDVAGVADAGAVNVLYGATGGLTSAGASRWHQDRAGIANRVGVGDLLGSL